MSKSLPDTRGKLDSNKDLNKKPKKKVKSKAFETFKDMSKEFKGHHEHIDTVLVQNKIKSSKETKGELFKKRTGVTKSLVKAMRRAGIAAPFSEDIAPSMLAAYRKIRKERKSKARKIKADKRAISVVKRRSGKRATKPKNKKK